jgi:regulator of protease activity HflC (stomatin/prohibitin superfamily)
MLVITIIMLCALILFTRYMYRVVKKGWKAHGGIKGWFTPFTPNLIQCVTVGDQGSIIKYIANLGDKDVDPSTGKIIPKVEIDKRTGWDLLDWTIREKYGYAYIGPPYQPWSRRIKMLKIDRVVWKATKEQLTTEYTIDKITSGPKDAPGLYHKFPRVNGLTDIDTASDFRIDLLTTAICEVEDASPAFTTYTDNLLQTASSIINSVLNLEIKRVTWEEFRKTIAEKLNEKNLDIINDLLKPTGLTITQLTYDDFGISKSSRPVQDALEERRIAQAEADAARERAKGKADSERTEAQGKADAARTAADAELYRLDKLGEGTKKVIVAEAEGEAERTQKLIAQYIATGMSAYEATKLVNEQIKNKDKWFHLQNLQTLVDGNTSGTIVSPGGKKDV